MYSDIINEIVKCVIAVVCIIVCKYFVPWIKANVDYKQIALIQSIAMSAVQAAEQIYAHGENNEKLAYATKMLEETLVKYGVTLSVEQIRTYIEDCVCDLKK